MEIEISKIQIGDSRRTIDGATVDKLAESMQQVGLLNPVTIDYGYKLIAGAHRIAAAKKLGWEFIPCTMLDMEEMQAKLAELDENLIRNQGSVIEQGEWLAEKKRIYEQLHPETKKGAVNQYTKVLNDKLALSKSEVLSEENSFSKDIVKTASEENSLANWVNEKNSLTKNEVTDNLTATSNDVNEENSLTCEKSFVADTAEKTGLSKRTIEQSIQIAENLTPEVKEFDKEVDISKTNALNLARKTPVEQHEIIEPIREAVQAVPPAERKQTANNLLNKKLASYKSPEEIEIDDKKSIFNSYSSAVMKLSHLEMKTQSISIFYETIAESNSVSDYLTMMERAIKNLNELQEYFLHPVKIGGFVS